MQRIQMFWVKATRVLPAGGAKTAAMLVDGVTQASDMRELLAGELTSRWLRGCCDVLSLLMWYAVLNVGGKQEDATRKIIFKNNARGEFHATWAFSLFASKWATANMSGRSTHLLATTLNKATYA